MHMRHVPSVFFTITGLDTHLGKNTALRILASTSFDTSVVIASLCSFTMVRFFYHTRKVRGWMLSLCSASSRRILVMSVGVHENTSLLERRSSQSFSLSVFGRLAAIVILVFSKACKVEAIAPSCIIPGWPRMMLYGDGALTIIKSTITVMIIARLFIPFYLDVAYVFQPGHWLVCLAVVVMFWILWPATKDETSGILKSFINGIENLVDHKVKVIRCDNGTEFKNREINQFCEMKGILRQFSVARTPQQNGVVERRNRTLIKAARTMLVDSKLSTTFWVEAINTACYVQNRVLVVKPHNKTPYKLFHRRIPTLSFIRPFGCLVTILNTIDHLGKFDGKADEGFFVRYSLNSKAE
ncbi:ribonuclease H-like domain-containing protein, partial [Tanacetum coccineum]